MATEKGHLKNYYEILEIPYNASIFDIENAYQKLAALWHPDKHKENRKLAEKKFHDISEAYETLSDRNSRSHYDQLLQKQFSLEDAEKTFEKFYSEHGMLDQSEQNFFNTHYPDRVLNYYAVLGVPSDASMADIKNAYRIQAMKYHPKKNPGNQLAAKKFIQINEAYNNLSNRSRRDAYNNWLFGAIQPFRAHDIFEDFFGNRMIDFPSEDEFLKPILARNWSKKLDSLMNEEKWNDIKDGEAYKTSTVYQKDKNGETKKTVTSKKKVDNGKVTETKTEEYLYPNGTRQITRTVNDNGKVETKKYNLAKGEQAPKELCN